MLSEWATRTLIQWFKKKWNRIDNKEWDFILPNGSLKCKGYRQSENGLSYRGLIKDFYFFLL